MTKSRFRIIALRPITPVGKDEETIARVKSIQKKVFGKDWLYFFDGYKLTDIPDAVAGDEDMQPFFGFQLNVPQEPNEDSMLYDTGNMAVSISAIVGKNGSGKSSAVELMIRILNNFSVAAKGEKKNHLGAEHLFYIEDVYGSIVAVIGNEYFQIQVYGRSVKMGTYHWDEVNHCYQCESMLDALGLPDKENKYRPIEGNGIGKMELNHLFYTAIFNYSMYAFNFYDYYEEKTKENRWIENSGEVRKDFEGEYTQDQCWLTGLFHKNDGYQTPIVLNPMREKGIINVPKENSLAKERVRNMLFFEGYKDGGHGGQPQFPFRYVNDHLEVVAIRQRPLKNAKFSHNNTLATLGYEDTPLASHFEEIRDIICRLCSGLMCMGHHEETEHEKLAWDYVVYKTLKIIGTYDKFDTLAKAILNFEEVDEKKIGEELRSLFRDNSHVTLKLRQALNFLKYKVFREHNEEDILLYDAYKRYQYQLDVFKQMNLRVNHESGHMTANIPEGYSEEDMPHFKVDPETMTLSISHNESSEHPIPVIYMEDGSLMARYPGEQEILPPPIFDMELMLIEKEKIKDDGSFDIKEAFPMSGLSSGERQIAGTVSNFAYHLANIDSVWEDNNLQLIGKIGNGISTEDKRFLFRYKHVNVIFDEVELYFHPDLQRRFVKYLLDALRNLDLQHIEGVNIQLVTHSPFVLSDIPATNMLCLSSDDDEEKPFGNTFAANIHDLFNNRFILLDTIGELAKTEILELVDLYDKQVRKWRNADELGVERLPDQELFEELKAKRSKFEYLARIVGDEYLQGELKGMLGELDEFYTNR